MVEQVPLGVLSGRPFRAYILTGKRQRVCAPGHRRQALAIADDVANTYGSGRYHYLVQVDGVPTGSTLLRYRILSSDNPSCHEGTIYSRNRVRRQLARYLPGGCMGVGGRLVNSYILSITQLTRVLLDNSILIHSNSDISALADVACGVGFELVDTGNGTDSIHHMRRYIDVSRHGAVVFYRMRGMVVAQGIGQPYTGMPCIDIDELITHRNGLSRVIQAIRWKLHLYR